MNRNTLNIYQFFYLETLCLLLAVYKLTWVLPNISLIFKRCNHFKVQKNISIDQTTSLHAIKVAKKSTFTHIPTSRKTRNQNYVRSSVQTETNNQV